MKNANDNTMFRYKYTCALEYFNNTSERHSRQTHFVTRFQLLSLFCGCFLSHFGFRPLQFSARIIILILYFQFFFRCRFSLVINSHFSPSYNWLCLSVFSGCQFFSHTKWKKVKKSRMKRSKLRNVMSDECTLYNEWMWMNTMFMIIWTGVIRPVKRESVQALKLNE